MKVYATDIKADSNDRLDFKITVEEVGIKTPDDIPAVLQELVKQVMTVSVETTSEWLREALIRRAEQWVDLNSKADVGWNPYPPEIREFMMSPPEPVKVVG